MQETFELDAVVRSDAGKGASRRLRRTGMVPGIIYGAGKEPQMFATMHSELIRHLEHEAFYSHILTVKLDGKAQKVVLKDMQRHPSKPFVTHLDLLRVSADEKLRMHVPLHFTGEAVAPGIKIEGGQFLHNMTDVEVICLPANLPEYIEVDVSQMHIGDLLHLSEIALPEGVELTAPATGGDHDTAVVHLIAKRAASGDEDGAAGEQPSDGAAGAAPTTD